MKKSGNGDPKQCVENLVSIVRGEIPFDRVRGMNARVIDMQSEDAKVEFENDARWNIETYEPRVNAVGLAITASDGINGGFTLDIDVSENNEEDD